MFISDREECHEVCRRISQLTTDMKVLKAKEKAMEEIVQYSKLVLSAKKESEKSVSKKLVYLLEIFA